MTNKNICVLKFKESTTSELNDDIEEDNGSKMKLQINAVHKILSRQKEGQDEEEGKGGKMADVELTQKANPCIEVEDSSKEEGGDQIDLGSIVSFEREKWSILSALRRAEKVEQKSSKECLDQLRPERRGLTKAQKQKINKESLFQRELKLTKAQQQTKSDNESLFQREMKLWQDKKDLCKERKTFDAAMVVGRRELRKGKEAGVRRLQQQVSKEKELSRIGSHLAMCKGPPNFNCVRFCFVAAFLFLFFLATLLILMILLNLMPDFDNLFGFS